MPAPPARPARSQPARAAAVVPSARRATAPTAAGVNPFCLPKRAHDLTGRALAPLREQGFAAWLDARRSPVAALLLLALDRGGLAEAEVHAALDGPHRHERLYALLGQAWRGLPGWIEAIARRHALDPARWPDWAPFVGIDLREDATGARLVLDARGVWLHAFDLDGLPPALAVAVAHALDLIGMRLTECVPGARSGRTVVGRNPGGLRRAAGHRPDGQDRAVGARPGCNRSIELVWLGLPGGFRGVVGGGRVLLRAGARLAAALAGPTPRVVQPDCSPAADAAAVALAAAARPQRAGVVSLAAPRGADAAPLRPALAGAAGARPAAGPRGRQRAAGLRPAAGVRRAVGSGIFAGLLRAGGQRRRRV